MKAIFAPFIGGFLLAGCASSQPIIQIERVSVPVFIPVPTTLTAPTKADLYPGITWGEAVITLHTAVETCNADKAAIATLKPPSGNF